MILTSHIDGAWVSPGKRIVTRENPGHSDQAAALWSPATRAQAKSAMDAAVRASAAWSNDASSHRIVLLDTLLNKIEDRLPTIAATITR